MRKKVCLIGGGYWGKNYIRLLLTLQKYFEFVAFVEKNTDIINNFKLNYPNIEVYDDISYIIDKVECCIIATPVSTHYEIAKYCLNKNKHVMIEKPLTDNVNNSQELTDLANEKNKILMVNFTPLFTEPYKWIFERYKDKLNEIRFVNCRRSNLGIIRNDCNVIIDLTCHDIAMLINLLGEPIKVNAIGKSFVSNNIDTISINLEFPNNIIGHIYTSWIDNKKQREFSLICENERIEYDDTNSI